MAINADMIVKVNPIIITPGGSSLEFNGLVLTKNDRIPISESIPGILQFSSPAAVGDYFGLTSPEYDYAQVYFKGYDNSSRKPSMLYVGRRIDDYVPAWVRGSSIRRLADLVAITDGEFIINFSGTVVTITPVNLSAITSFSEAASILQAAIRAASPADFQQAENATVEYNSDYHAFTVTAGIGEDGLTISDITGNLATAMFLASDQNPTISDGSSSEAVPATMNRLLQTTANWVSFSSIWKMDVNEIIEYGEWLNLFPVRFAFFPWDDDPNATVPTDKSDLASIFADLDLAGVFPKFYDNYRLSAAASGFVASVNYRAIQGAITYAFKKQTGLAYNVNDKETAVALRDKGWNFYGNYATANDRFIFYYQGTSPGGDWKWLDTYMNAIWLNNELQLAGMRTLTLIPRIPYNERGYSFIRRGLMGPINRAVGTKGDGCDGNGVIDVGVTLSELQKVEIIREAGMDITPDLNMYGFYLMVRDPAPEDREQRLSPLIWLWYCYGGSVHRLDIVSAAVT